MLCWSQTSGRLITGGFRAQLPPLVGKELSGSLMEQTVSRRLRLEGQRGNPCPSCELSGVLQTEQSGPFSLAIRYPVPPGEGSLLKKVKFTFEVML